MGYFSIYEDLKFQALLKRASKKLYNLGARSDKQRCTTVEDCFQGPVISDFDRSEMCTKNEDFDQLCWYIELFGI